MAHTLLRRAVEVAVARQSCLLPGTQERLAQRVRLCADGAGGERTAGAAPFAGSERAVLHPAKVRQHVTPAPAGIALRLPRVEIAGLPAHEHHRVDRARAAQELPARPVPGAIAERGFGLGPVHPVDARIVEALAVADRHPDAEAVVAAAGFEQQHAMAAVGREAIREHAARRSRRRRRCSRRSSTGGRVSEDAHQHGRERATTRGARGRSILGNLQGQSVARLLLQHFGQHLHAGRDLRRAHAAEPEHESPRRHLREREAADGRHGDAALLRGFRDRESPRVRGADGRWCGGRSGSARCRAGPRAAAARNGRAPRGARRRCAASAASARRSGPRR